MINMIYFIGLVLSWLFFYKILTAKKSRFPKIKATIIVLLFGSLIYKFSYDLLAVSSRALFSSTAQGSVELNQSPFRIPLNQDITYCNRFTDQNGQAITAISSREDGKYCGTFWRFDRNKAVFLPYKSLNEKQNIFWASPVLKIISPK